MKSQGLNGKTILVVDDAAENVQQLAGLLTGEGYRVVAATGGAWAVSAIRNERPDLILLDVLMKGMDGFETLRWIRSEANGRDVPVIFLSSFAEKEDVMRGFAEGAVDYIKKPFRSFDLILRVRTHIDLSCRRRSLEKRISETETQRRRVESKLIPLVEILERAEESGSERGALVSGLLRIAKEELTHSIEALRDENFRAEQGGRGESVRPGECCMSELFA